MAAPSQLSFGSVVIYDDQVLGVGSYGKVCKAKYGQLPCAAKLLHDTMFEGGDPGIFKFAERFEQECQLLSMVKHPNIVQYLGTYKNAGSLRLALLMELMDESLTTFLEQSNCNLPYHTQLSICRDVALALSYLHSNAIVHRDLSSNNVLLIGEGSRAKVTDFGMSKLMDMNPRMTPRLTVCPGATVYMPPEALTTPPHYSSKLDCFSHGVLTIQILTRNFPKPGDAHRAVEDPNYPTGEILIKVPETERRRKDIDLIEPNHPLLPLALRCLHNRATERLSADEVCERLATLKKEERYTHSVEQTRNKASLFQTLKRELGRKEQVIQQLRESHDCETRALRRELEQNNEIIQQKNADYKTELKLKNELICSLKTDHAVQLQKERDDKKRELEEKEKLIEQILEEHHEGRNTATGGTSANKGAMAPVIARWREGKSTIQEFCLARGTSLVYGNTAYFSHEYDIYSFTRMENHWARLPPCPHQWFAMAVIDDKLTTVGGQQSKTMTNALLSIDMGKWETVFPPMPTKRSLPAAVTTPTHLVVAGGRTDSIATTNVVEVLNTSTLEWSTASSLPIHPRFPRMSLCGRHIYLANNADVISCSTEELLKSCEHNSSDDGSVWTTLPDIPVLHGASLVSVRGHVLAIGGQKKGLRSTTPAIHWYNQATNSWSNVGELPTPLSDTLAAVLRSNEVIVVGGYGKSGEHSSNTYITL